MDRRDIEFGDEPIEAVRRPKGPGAVVSARLAPEEAQALARMAEAQGKTLSQIAREALVGYVTGGGQRQPSSAGAGWTVTGTRSAEMVFSYAENQRGFSTTGHAQGSELTPSHR